MNKSNVMLREIQTRTTEEQSPDAKIALLHAESEKAFANAARIMFATMYYEARDLNAGINNQRARLLARAGAFLTAGFVLAAASHLLVKL